MRSFFQLFKKKKKVSRSSDYYSQENLITTPGHLDTLYRRKPVLRSSYTIMFQEMKLDDIDLDKLNERLGEESYILDNNEHIPGHRVHFFKENADKYSLTIQVHFIHGLFFYASTKISSGAHMPDADKRIIALKVLNRYPDISMEEDLLEYEILDKNGNMLFLTDQMYYFINLAICPDNNKYLKLVLDDYKINQGGNVRHDKELDRFF